MRPALLTLLILSPAAFAQSNPTQLVEQGVRGAIATFTPVPEKDQAAILRAAAELLSHHVTFRPDGTASSICTFSSRKHIEWKKLVVTRITRQHTTEADRLNGITGRYLASLSCDGHRSWDNKKNAWGQWYATGYAFFPAALSFEWKDNRWNATESMIKHFQPGPGPSIAAPAPTTAKPAPPPGTDGLPPGMTRAKAGSHRP